MSRRTRRFVFGGVVGGVVVAALLGGPRLLRALPLFEVRAVEVSGVRLLAPHEVLRALPLAEGQSVWDDPAPWEAALERHPAIESATVSRRLPATLRVRVEEKQPVALVEDGSLAPVTAAGERLPIDPTRAPANLPIARGARGDSVPPALLEEVRRLGAIDPALLAEVSEVRARDGAGRSMLLKHPRADVIVPAGMPEGRLEELRTVLADLRRRGIPDSAGIARVDLRFAGQVVVRLPISVQTP